jgi:hypothetical protein
LDKENSLLNLFFDLPSRFSSLILMSKKRVNWERFEDEDEGVPPPVPIPVKKEEEKLTYTFSEREVAQEYSKWERQGNRLVTDTDRTRFREYLTRQAALKALAIRNMKDMWKPPPVKTPMPVRPQAMSSQLVQALKDEKAISSDDLFSEGLAPSVFQQIGQKILALREQLTEAADAPDSETTKSGLL